MLFFYTRFYRIALFQSIFQEKEMQKLLCYTAFWVVVALALFFVRPMSGVPTLSVSDSPTVVLVKDTRTPKAVAAKNVTPPKDIRPKQESTRKKNGSPLTEKEFDLLLAQSPGPGQLHDAVKQVAFCESSWVPVKRGPTDDHGIMQVRFKAHAEKVGRASVLYNPLRNLEIAYTVFEEARRGKFRHGFAPWHASYHCHGLVPKKVAANIKKFEAQKAKRVMRNF